MKNYKVVNGMSFDESTNNMVCNILSTTKERIRVYYGDTITGKCWMDENDTIGTVERSCGLYKIPLLIKNSRSTGGGAILDSCVIRIDSVTRKKILYKQDNFYMPAISVNECIVLFDGDIYANCDTNKQANKLAQFMRGDRYAK